MTSFAHFDTSYLIIIASLCQVCIPPPPLQFPIISSTNQVTWQPLTTSSSVDDLMAGLMATWYPNEPLAPMPDLAVPGDQYGVCGTEGVTVCAPSFDIVRAGEYIYIEVLDNVNSGLVPLANHHEPFCFIIDKVGFKSGNVWLSMHKAKYSSDRPLVATLKHFAQ